MVSWWSDQAESLRSISANNRVYCLNDASSGEPSGLLRP